MTATAQGCTMNRTGTRSCGASGPSDVRRSVSRWSPSASPAGFSVTENVPGAAPVVALSANQGLLRSASTLNRRRVPTPAMVRSAVTVRVAVDPRRAESSTCSGATTSVPNSPGRRRSSSRQVVSVVVAKSATRPVISRRAVAETPITRAAGVKRGRPESVRELSRSLLPNDLEGRHRRRLPPRWWAPGRGTRRARAESHL